jgi:protein phosphatase
MTDTILSAGYEFGSALDRGQKRKDEPNQDSLGLVLHPYPPLLVVADGMGGHSGGTVAGKMVVDVFREQYLKTPHPAAYPALLETCARKAHYAVRVYGAQQRSLANMGSTVVAVVIHNEQVHLVNVGDSRAYILRENRVLQISQDQSWVADQVRAGLLTPQQALKHPKRNRLSMAINAKRDRIEPYLTSTPLEPEDIIILCSDGLWGAVPENLLFVAAELPPQEAAEKLVALANRSFGPDNISIIIARRHLPNRKPPASVEDTMGG